jgi:hypothetical protein
MIKNIEISDLFRYVFSGSIFLGAYFASRSGFSAMGSIAKSMTSNSATVLALAAVIFGSLIYTIHRTFYYYLIIPIHFKWPQEYKSKEFERDISRWIRRCNFPIFQQNLDRWASHVNFLYCSAWATLTGAVVGRVILMHNLRKGDFCGFVCHPWGRSTFLGMVVFFVVFLLAAYLGDRILTYYDDQLRQANQIQRLAKEIHKAEAGEKSA